MGHECGKIFFRENFNEPKSKQISSDGQGAKLFCNHEILPQIACA